MSESLQLELKPQGIGVSVLCPGPVTTDIIARTRSVQPKVTRTLTPEQRNKAFARNEEMTKFLANGTRPDAVGDMVRDAIRGNRLYVHTDRSMIEPIKMRSKALLDAMGD